MRNLPTSYQHLKVLLIVRHRLLFIMHFNINKHPLQMNNIAYYKFFLKNYNGLMSQLQVFKNNSIGKNFFFIIISPDTKCQSQTGHVIHKLGSHKSWASSHVSLFIKVVSPSRFLSSYT